MRREAPLAEDWTTGFYFHDRFMKLRGQPDDANPLYRACAGSPYSQKWTVALATQRLRENKWDVPQTREKEPTRVVADAPR